MQVLIGRIIADARVNKTNNEKNVVNFSIALNHSYKDKTGEKKELTTFVNCAFWKSTGIANYLTKGTLVEVAGHLYVKAYTDRNGEAKASLNTNVDKITLHGKPKGEATNSKNDTGKRKGGKKSAQPVTDTENVSDPVDDLPF